MNWRQANATEAMKPEMLLMKPHEQDDPKGLNVPDVPLRDSRRPAVRIDKALSSTPICSALGFTGRAWLAPYIRTDAAHAF
jgi:hypothetical protein